MRKNTIKKLVIAMSLGLFGFGSVLALRVSKEDNSFKDDTIAETKLAGMTEEKETIAETTAIKEVETTSEISTKATETYTTEQHTTEATTQPIVAETTQPPTTEAQAETTVATTTEATKSEEEIMYAQAVANVNTYGTLANEVRNLINQERANVGIGYVSYDSTLDIMASYRATENATNNWFVVEDGKHIRPNGQKAATICTQFGQYGYFGEVMGRYQTTPAEIVLGWHNSPTHYACMTNAKYTRVGIGIAQDSKGNYYWVAIFMN